MTLDTAQMLYHEWLLVKEKELREEKDKALNDSPVRYSIEDDARYEKAAKTLAKEFEEARKHFTTKSKCVILNKSEGDI